MLIYYLIVINQSHRPTSTVVATTTIPLSPLNCRRRRHHHHTHAYSITTVKQARTKEEDELASSSLQSSVLPHTGDG